MKGIVLGGGLGTRLRPYLSQGVNKHLVPIHDKPLLHHVLNTLSGAGVNEVLVCLNGPNPGLILESVGSGSDFGLNVSYTYDNTPMGRGPAAHILDAQHWIGNESFVLILGDSLYFIPLVLPKLRPNTAHLWAMEITQRWDDFRKYAQIQIQGSTVTRMERTETFFSPLIQTGAWIFPADVFEKVQGLYEKKDGNEVRLTHVAQLYLARNSLTAELLPPESFIDCGTPDAVNKAARKLAAV